MSRTSNGLINYVRSGSGQPVMLVHGVGANLSGWDAVCASLGAGYDVLRLDLRGHGASDHIVSTDFSIDDFARDVLAVMDEEHVACADLVGFSLGGLITQRLAQKWPDRFRRVVIISAVAGRTPQERERVLSRLAAIKEGGISTIVGSATDRWFTEAFAKAHPQIIQRRVEELKANHVPSYMEAYRVFGETELVDALDQIPHETLVMTGEFDQGSNVRMAETMARLIPRSQLEILPGLKHSVLAEAPMLIADHIKRFLN